MGNGERIRGDGVGDREAGNIRSVDGKRIECIGRGCGIPHEYLVVVPEVVIVPETALIVVIGFYLRALVQRWRDIAERVQIPGGQPYGTEHRGRNFIAREWRARKFVNQRRRLTRARIH